jgi:HEAT repeat protein
MKKIGSLLIVVALALLGCKGEEKKEAPKPAPVVDKAPPPEPAKPAEPVYSPEAAAKLVAAMETCEYDFSCDAYKTLVGFGAKAAPEIAKLACDAAKPAKGRSVAAKALAEIKDPASGKALFDAARAEKDFMLRGDLFDAAGKSGSDEVLAAAGALFLTDEGWEIRVELMKSIAPFGKKAFDWAAAELPKRKDKFTSSLADVLGETATAAELAALQELLGKTKDVMARNLLASKLIELGDLTQFPVLLAGLESKDVYDRSHAAGQVAKVADKVPADLKDKFIKALEAGKAGDSGGMTAMGYDEALKVLKK